MTNQELTDLLRESMLSTEEAAAAFQRLREQAEANPLLIQHQTFIDVLFDFQRSRWPWVRWTAKRMQEEIVRRWEDV